MDKVFFLEKFTRGRGYREAAQLLKDHHGNHLKIATALMDKLSKWPPIKFEDARSLHSFSIFLVNCSDAMEAVDYMDELDNLADMKVVISKLPYKMKEKWSALLSMRSGKLK